MTPEEAWAFLGTRGVLAWEMRLVAEQVGIEEPGRVAKERAAVREAMLAAFRLGVSSVGVSRASAPDCIAENEARIQALGERTVDTDPAT